MVIFNAPVIGPRVYVSEGGGGWSETFPRKEADQALLKILGAIPLALAVEGIVRKQKAEKTPFAFKFISAYLAELCRLPEDSFPPNVIVAFWAAVLLALADRGN